MSKIIESVRRCFLFKERTKEQTFKITLQGMYRINSLSPSATNLLLSIINKVEITKDPESYAVEGTYKDFGYSNRQVFHRDKNRLVDNELLFVDGNKYLVNIIYIDFTNRRQHEHFRGYFGLKKNLKPNIGGNKNNNIPKPPNK